MPVVPRLRGAGSGRRTRRDAVLLGAVLWGVWLVAGTELLGAANALTRPALIAWWGLPSLALLLWAIWRMRAMTPAGRAAPQPVRLDWPATAMTVSVLALLLARGVVAALTPPNNWDAQSYHLPRQVFWMQQGSVAHFPTENLRQTVMPPFAEFAGLHLMILAGSDQWANLVQWFALAITAIGASLVARELGAAARGQALAAPLTEPELIIGIGDPLLWLDRPAARYVAVSFCPPMLTLFVPQDAAARYGALPAPPAFAGWRTGWLSLMGDFEGPYPEQDLPLVRWGLGPASVLEFASDGRGDVLVLDARPVPGIPQTLQLELNGVATATLELGSEAVFRQFRIPLAAKRGSNVLRIGYSGWECNGERPLALLYRSLQILPASRGSDPVPVPAANPGVPR